MELASKLLLENLNETTKFFLMFNGTEDVSDGWKLSIQGKTLANSIELFESLHTFLIESNCSYKFGTKRLIEIKHPQQSTKLLTVYIPNGIDVKEFVEKLYSLIPNYKGGQDIRTPDGYEHYANAIYFRNDRDVDGEYIPAITDIRNYK